MGIPSVTLWGVCSAVSNPIGPHGCQLIPIFRCGCFGRASVFLDLIASDNLFQFDNGS